jgi:hypothetical protein
MKKTFSLLCLLLCLCLLTACTYDTFTPNSTSDKFKLKTVTSVTISGPSADEANEQGIQIELTAESGIKFTRLVQLIEGKKEDTCETNDFGLCYLTFTFQSGDTTKVYPANDGSNHLCLYSLNKQHSKYLTLEDAAMKEIIAIIEGAGVQVIY